MGTLRDSGGGLSCVLREGTTSAPTSIPISSFGPSAVASPSPIRSLSLFPEKVTWKERVTVEMGLRGGSRQEVQQGRPLFQFEIFVSLEGEGKRRKMDCGKWVSSSGRSPLLHFHAGAPRAHSLLLLLRQRRHW